MDMSSKIKAIIEEMGMSEYEFAAYLGVNRSMVCRWLHGTEPSLKAIRLIIERCPIDANTLLGEGGSDEGCSKPKGRS